MNSTFSSSLVSCCGFLNVTHSSSFHWHHVSQLYSAVFVTVILDTVNDFSMLLRWCFTVKVSPALPLFLLQLCSSARDVMVTMT